MLKENPHLDAYDIYELASEEDSSIGLATVYRSLKYLKDNGYIIEHRFNENHSHYEPVDTEERALNHAHFICKVCGKIEERDIPENVKIFEGDESGFEVDFAHVTFYGKCGDCKIK